MIFDRLGIWRALFPTRAATNDCVPRWRRAATDCPELMEDLLRLGGVLVLQPIDGNGVDMKDPNRLAYEAGRRDLAVQLLSMMALTPRTLTILMEDNDD